MLSFFAFLPLGIKAGRRPVTSYYGGGDAMIPMRIDYVVGTTIAIAWEHHSNRIVRDAASKDHIA